MAKIWFLSKCKGQSLVHGKGMGKALKEAQFTRVDRNDRIDVPITTKYQWETRRDGDSSVRMVTTQASEANRIVNGKYVGIEIMTKCAETQKLSETKVKQNES